ncbi:uncharacterized protein LOC131884110 [Tigriopus californicus]|uniref:uncharacterized protein LOC131884110 n=1 Tax=Tigriopus californicus TaxID=6832 RepID=UPI0027D9DAC2|nr:uncharacterized protein LOC131884110 [Tigriopus californicus]
MSEPSPTAPFTTTAFQHQLRIWLERTGAVRQLRTQVRAHLIRGLPHPHAIQGPPHVPTPSPRQRALNHLILERLMLGGHWLTASVWASEAHFLSTIPVSAPPVPRAPHLEPPPLPAKLNDEALDTIFRHLQLGHGDQSEQFRTAYYRRQDVALLDIMLTALVPSVTAWDHRNIEPAAAPCPRPSDIGRDQTRRDQLGQIKDNLLKQAAEESYASQASEPEAPPVCSVSSVSPSSVSSMCSNESGDTTTTPTMAARIQTLEDALAQARQEIESLRRSPAPVAELQALVNVQTREFDQIRHQLSTFNDSVLNPASGVPESTPVLEFLAASRHKVDHLYQSGLAIDREIHQTT